MKTTIQKQRRVLLVLAVLGATVFGVYKWLDHQGERRASMNLFIPADVNGDGLDDMIVVYAPVGDSDEALMEAIDLTNEETLWTSTTTEVDSFFLEFPRVFDVGADHFVVSRGRFLHSGTDQDSYQSSITVHELSSGRTVWEHAFPSGRRLHLYFHLWVDEELLLAATQREYRGDETLITAFEISTGRQLWETPLPSDFPIAPLFIDESILIGHSRSTTTIERTTGESSTMDTAGYAVFGWEEQSVLALSAGGTGYVVGAYSVADGATQPIMVGNEPVTLRGANPYEAVGLFGGNRIIALLGGHLATRIVSIPLTADHQGYTYEFPDGFGYRGMFHEWKRHDPSVSVFHVISDRFIPMMLRLDIAQSEQQQKLVVFDLEEGRIVWESSMLNHYRTRFTANQILYKDGLYFIGFPYDLPGEGSCTALLIFDGQTGQFRAALRVQAPVEGGVYRYYPEQLYAWMLGEGRLYGAEHSRFWVIGLDDMSLLYSSDENLSLESVWSEVEQVLGPMPRE